MIYKIFLILINLELTYQILNKFLNNRFDKNISQYSSSILSFFLFNFLIYSSLFFFKVTELHEFSSIIYIVYFFCFFILNIILQSKIKITLLDILTRYSFVFFFLLILYFISVELSGDQLEYFQVGKLIFKNGLSSYPPLGENINNGFFGMWAHAPFSSINYSFSSDTEISYLLSKYFIAFLFGNMIFTNFMFFYKNKKNILKPEILIQVSYLLFSLISIYSIHYLRIGHVEIYRVSIVAFLAFLIFKIIENNYSLRYIFLFLFSLFFAIYIHLAQLFVIFFILSSVFYYAYFDEKKILIKFDRKLFFFFSSASVILISFIFSSYLYLTKVGFPLIDGNLGLQVSNQSNFFWNLVSRDLIFLYERFINGSLSHIFREYYLIVLIIIILIYFFYLKQKNNISLLLPEKKITYILFYPYLISSVISVAITFLEYDILIKNPRYLYPLYFNFGIYLIILFYINYNKYSKKNIILKFSNSLNFFLKKIKRISGSSKLTVSYSIFFIVICAFIFVIGYNRPLDKNCKNERFINTISCELNNDLFKKNTEIFTFNKSKIVDNEFKYLVATDKKFDYLYKPKSINISKININNVHYSYASFQSRKWYITHLKEEFNKNCQIYYLDKTDVICHFENSDNVFNQSNYLQTNIIKLNNWKKANIKKKYFIKAKDNVNYITLKTKINAYGKVTINTLHNLSFTVPVFFQKNSKIYFKNYCAIKNIIICDIESVSIILNYIQKDKETDINHNIINSVLEPFEYVENLYDGNKKLLRLDLNILDFKSAMVNNDYVIISDPIFIDNSKIESLQIPIKDKFCKKIIYNFTTRLIRCS